MEDGVHRARLALTDALARGDAPAAADLYAYDGKLLSPSAELIRGRLDIEAYWSAGIAFGLSCLELDPFDVEVADGLAIEIGRYVLAVAREGDVRARESGKYLVFHRQDGDGRWRRAVDVFNPDVPAAARHNSKEER